MFIFFIALSTIGICQTKPQYVNSAREKIKNKSWECVKACINGDCHTAKNKEHYITYLDEADEHWLGEKYRGLYRYSTVMKHDYTIDSSNKYKTDLGTDKPAWLFIDSITSRPGEYFFVNRSPVPADDEYDMDHIIEISFLSDTEFVSSYVDGMGWYRKGYYKLCNTRPEFYKDQHVTPR
ncbi:MAG: hypothetical protein JWQ38_3144 [Flavipsychrobacter sp.]|nr:hypothetical protein [Flavipsychrobacter sp.]